MSSWVGCRRQQVAIRSRPHPGAPEPWRTECSMPLSRRCGCWLSWSCCSSSSRLRWRWRRDVSVCTDCARSSAAAASPPRSRDRGGVRHAVLHLLRAARAGRNARRRGADLRVDRLPAGRTGPRSADLRRDRRGLQSVGGSPLRHGNVPRRARRCAGRRRRRGTGTPVRHARTAVEMGARATLRRRRGPWPVVRSGSARRRRAVAGDGGPKPATAWGTRLV